MYSTSQIFSPSIQAVLSLHPSLYQPSSFSRSLSLQLKPFFLSLAPSCYLSGSSHLKAFKFVTGGFFCLSLSLPLYLPPPQKASSHPHSTKAEKSKQKEGRSSFFVFPSPLLFPHLLRSNSLSELLLSPGANFKEGSASS